MLERAKEVTRQGPYTYLEDARFADDRVILVEAYHKHDGWVKAVNKRLREELATLHVPINETKSRMADLAKGESGGFLGFDFRRVRSLRGVWRASYTPRLKKRTAWLRRLKDIFRRSQSQPVDRVIALMHPILRGWVNYFAIGHSSRCFGYVRDGVEKKVCRHLMRARKRRGFGWKRWSRRWLSDRLGLCGPYRVRRLKQLRLKALPA
jgi:RNA-directed DNA polymerase